MTKLFLDTEFTGLHKDTNLISIALVSECGKQFYAEFNDYPIEQLERMGCKDDVLNNLKFNDMRDCCNFENDFTDFLMKDNSKYIARRLTEWLQQFESVEIICDFVAWDWVLFCDLFGGAFNIPKHIFYIPLDICGLFQLKDIDPDINRIDFCGGIDNYLPHNCLSDAHIIKKCYQLLTTK